MINLSWHHAKLLGDVLKSYLFECRKNDVIDSFDEFNNPDQCHDDPNLGLVYPVYICWSVNDADVQ